jgi:hypothetical protein
MEIYKGCTALNGHRDQNLVDAAAGADLDPVNGIPDI